MPQNNDTKNRGTQADDDAIRIPSTEELDELTDLDTIAYADTRRDVASFLNMNVSTLDALVKDHRRKRQEAKKASEKEKQKAKFQQDGWRGELLLNELGRPKPLLNNAIVALRGASIWNGVLSFDDLSLLIIVSKPPPWQHGRNQPWEPRRWNDVDDAQTTAWLERQGITVKPAYARQAAQVVARDATYHPVRDYLNSLEWDGTHRVEGFATTYLGAADTPYHQCVSRCALIAGVARIMEPGCQVDYVPVLEEAQGILKSSAIRRMFDPYFTDDLSGMDTKDAKMEMQGVWCVEVAELASMQRSQVEAIKAFITRRKDRFRPSYGHNVIEAPRQAVIWGTTNKYNWQKDDTGGRRFWPIRCGEINFDLLTTDRDQLWAEAVHLYKQGEKWWLTPEEEKAAKSAQDERRMEDPWEAGIKDYIRTRVNVSVPELLGRCPSSGALRQFETFVKGGSGSISVSA